MTESSKSTPSTNIWIKLSIIVAVLLCIAIFVLGVMAHSKGMLSNLLGFLIMLGIAPLIALRLPFAITKTIDWGFWKSPFSEGNRGKLGHIVARLVFWSLALFTFKIASSKYAFDAATMMALNAMVIGGFVLIILASLFPKRQGNWPMTAFSIATSLCLAVVLMRSLMPTLDSGEVVTVGPPIAGESLMSHAGHDALINYHYAHRSQQHAFDVVAMQEEGFEYMGQVKEDDPCFGRDLLAAVDGEVVTVVKDLIDQEIGGRDPKNVAGNHVVIKMDETHYALSAHMKQNSATVSEGETVKAGQVIGQCGNSGNTSKPHLHFQIQRYPDLFTKGGYTYPVRFKGVTRLRNGQSETGGGLYFRRNDIMIAPDIHRNLARD